jgi:hypothetical protein
VGIINTALTVALAVGGMDDEFTFDGKIVPKRSAVLLVLTVWLVGSFIWFVHTNPS